MGLVDVNKTERVEIPHEVDQWVELRQLTGAQLQEAADVNTRNVIIRMGDTFSKVDPEVVKSMREEVTENKDDAAALAIETLLNYGLAGWSYPEPCDEIHKMLLDAQTRDWLVETITKMNVISPLVRMN